MRAPAMMSSVVLEVKNFHRGTRSIIGLMADVSTASKVRLLR